VPGSCGAFGNVIAVRGSAALRDHGTFAHAATGQTEQKGWACIISNLFSLTACSGHITSLRSPTNVRQNQLAELADKATSYLEQNLPTWIAGDFNQTYPDNATAFGGSWYSRLHESDAVTLPPKQKRITTDSGGMPNPNSVPRAIDYIFTRAPVTVSDDAYLLNSSASDHHWLQMYC